MITKIKNKSFYHSLLALMLIIVMIIGFLPITNVQAAQNNDYRDPAEYWMSTGNRTSELDVNANVTYETQHCGTCDKNTSFITYRVPEYTRSGQTALNRGVMWSDGTMIDGVSKGNLDAGTPGVNAYYTGYHWTKSICQNCGGDGGTLYNLYDCAAGFMVDFSDTHHDSINDNYHYETKTSGKYCHFCHGTNKTTTTTQKSHKYHEDVDPQLGNQRFQISAHCEDCEHQTKNYKTAKSIVTSYYGIEDGKAHTISLADLSDNGVNTSIRYGTTATNCNLTSSPNFTQAGYNSVYYNISYSYSGESMSENGVAYVQILEDTSKINSTVTATDTAHTHDYHYYDTVQPSCKNLGYDNYQCDGCGHFWKTNYKNAAGHNHKATTIREASCTTSGMKLHICTNCGDFYEETTPMLAHSYNSKVIPSTCFENGYTEHTCTSCKHTYITDLKPLTAHRYTAKYTPANCTEKGFNTYTCLDCKDSYTSDFTNPTGHNWDNGTPLTSSTCESEGVNVHTCKICGEKNMTAISAKGHRAGAAATCTIPQICLDCNSILKTATGHKHKETVTAPTCEKMGFSTFKCSDCIDSYIGNYTDKTAHDYKKTVKAPTCTETGHTTYNCKNCIDSYVSDYTDKLAHDYNIVVTAPTCREIGFTTSTCKDCGSSYKGDYKTVLPHNYKETVTAPVCEDMGYSVYICKDCGETYTGTYKDPKGHNHKPNVTAPTCEEMGFTTFICSDCNDTYIANYTNKIPHDYKGIVTAPTCTASGFTVFSCNSCGDSYTSIYTDPTPHKYHAETTAPTCTELGFTTNTCVDCGASYVNKYIEVIPHDYAETVTAPTCKTMGFTTFVCVDCNDSHISNYTEVLPHRHDTTVTAPTCTHTGHTTYICADCGETVIADYTDMLPHDFIVEVTAPTCEEMGYTTYTCPDCGISAETHYTEPLGHKKSDWIVDVPSTIEATGSKHFECTVCGVVLKTTVITMLPSYAVTDEDGKGNVGNYIVIVTDESGAVIENAEIWIDTLNKIKVKLPTEKLLDFEDKTTVTVLYAENDNVLYGELGANLARTPVEGVNVAISDKNNNNAIGMTDENGKTILPDKKTDTGDGNGTIGGGDGEEENKFTYVVTVTDKDGNVVKNCNISLGESNDIVVKLPTGTLMNRDNPITVTVADQNGVPKKDIAIIVIGDADYIEKGKTDINGKLTVPPQNKGYTDEGGKIKVNGFIVIVNDESGFIKNAFVTLTEDNKITVLLPEAKKIDYKNRTTVTVITKDGEAVKDMSVTISDTTEKTETGLTDENGKLTVPSLNTDYTGADGKAKVNGYSVKVEDTKTPIQNAFVTISTDGKITVLLPDTSILDSNNQITVTVLNDKAEAVKDMSVTVNDKNNATATKTTDTSGKIVVPNKPSTGGGSSGGGGGGSYGGSSYVTTTTIIKVTDKDGKIVSNPSIGAVNGVTNITLPTGYKLSGNNFYTITATDSRGAVIADMRIILKDKDGESAEGYTDENGVLILPGILHKAYIVGYPNGDFRPDYNMTRAEAAAIFARLLSEQKGEKINGSSYFPDIASGEWYTNYVNYLKSYSIIVGYTDGTFRPNDQITRAEFVTMTVRFYSAYYKTSAKNTAQNNTFADVQNTYWAVTDISTAVSNSWVIGYPDSTFKGESNISRCEVVTIVNRVLGRTADPNYIDKNTLSLTRFNDLADKKHWAYYDIMEAANDHITVQNSNTETWIKQ